LLSGCAGNKGLGEQLPKGRVVLAPSFANECRHGFVSVDLVLIAAPAPALGVSAIENEMRYALGMADGIGDRHGAALRDAEKRKPVEAARIGDAFKIGHHR